MGINYHFTIMIIALSMMFIFIIRFVVKDIMRRILLFLTTISAVFFTGIGLTFEANENLQYVFSYSSYLFVLFFSLLFITRSGEDTKIEFDKGYKDLVENSSVVIKFLAVVSIISQLSLLIYPELKLINLIQPPKYGFDAVIFQVRLYRSSDMIDRALSMIRVASFPFLLVYLYSIRKKPFVFISIILFYKYVEYVDRGYLPRNEFLAIAAFIILYLYLEGFISSRVFKSIVVIGILAIPPIMYGLFFIRVGGSFSFNIHDYINIFVSFIRQEGAFQTNLQFLDSLSHELSFIKLIIQCLSAPLFFLPDINFPVLSYYYTELMLGLSYGDKNYYIILPNAYGEALMVLGKWGAWVYALFIGLFIGFIFNYMKKTPQFKYVLLFVILELAKAFRGGIQTFTMYTINSLVLLFIVMLVLTLIDKKKNHIKY